MAVKRKKLKDESVESAPKKGETKKNKKLIKKEILPQFSVGHFSLLLDTELKSIKNLLKKNKTLLATSDAEKLRDIAVSSGKKQTLALLILHDTKAYKLIGYKSFGKFVQADLSLSPSNASRIVNAARIAKDHFGVEYVETLSTDSLLPLTKLDELEILFVIEHLKEVNNTDVLDKSHVTRQSVEDAISAVLKQNEPVNSSEKEVELEEATLKAKLTADPTLKRVEILEKFVAAYESQTTKNSYKALTKALVSVLSQQNLINAYSLISEKVCENIASEVQDMMKNLQKTVS